MEQEKREPVIPEIRSLDDKLGEATAVRIPPYFTERLPVPVRCKRCDVELDPIDAIGLAYRHPSTQFGICRTMPAYSVHGREVLDAAMTALLKQPIEPEKSVYRRLHENIRNIYVTPIGAGRFAIEVELRDQKRTRSAA